MTDVTTLPARTPVDEHAYAAVLGLLRRGGAAVLTGAGMSTASGIPDYRGPDGLRRVRPMQYAEFLADPAGRRRYWARAYVGWQRFASARPNAGHRAVTSLQRAGALGGLITQNVDGLHQVAGARAIIELHGNLGRVLCLDCSARYPRDRVQEWLRAANPQVGALRGEMRPDGDVIVDTDTVQRFVLATCRQCSGDRLQPDVVFFGATVQRDVVDRAYAVVESASSLLVLGSSLQVMSGYRFVRRAVALGLPVALLTRGPTRGDADCTIRVDALLGDVLPRLADEVAPG